MTNEEAIERLNNIWIRDALQEDYDAVEMAIAALKAAPCEDAVSKQAVNEIINDIRDCISVEGYWSILERMKKLPPVISKQRTGKWIMTSDYLTTAYGSIDYVKCSCCGEDSLEEGNYCCNCGARMNESEE